MARKQQHQKHAPPRRRTRSQSKEEEEVDDDRDEDEDADETSTAAAAAAAAPRENQRKTRKQRRAASKNDDEDDDDENGGRHSSEEGGAEEEDAGDEDPPQPVSSDCDDEAEEEGDSTSSSSASGDGDEAHDADAASKKTARGCLPGTSRLFTPYRTLGIVSSGRPFHLIPHDNSQSAMICLPIGDRFQLLQTDRLHPVLVSQAVPSSSRVRGGRSKTQNDADRSPSREHISHCVTDASLSITVVAHGHQAVTLYQRTRPLRTLRVLNRSMKRADWSILSLLHLGRVPVEMKGQKEGRKENAAVIAVVLSRSPNDDNDEQAEGVPVVGDDDDDSYGSSSDDDNSSSSEGKEDGHRGQVVIILATRNTLQMHRRIRLTALPKFLPMTAMHPATYLNKIILAGADQEGHPAMCLLNIRSSMVVHYFRCLPQAAKGRVLIVEQSPAVDTVAVGTDQGMVHLVNLRHDKLLFSLRHRSRVGTGRPVAINSISFRTDGSAMRYGIAPMAVGRSDGTITVWDLTPPEDRDTGRTILCEMERVHVGGVTMLQYMPQEPLLLSIGTHSNAVIMHIFDNPSHEGRILRQRKGHTSPPTRIQYLRPGVGGVLVNEGTDASTCQVLSSGGPDRSLRVFSTARSVLDKEYSQGKGLEKRARKLGLESMTELLLPPLKSMDLSDSRSRDWGDLVTIHENHSFAYVWSTKRGAQSGPILRQLDWNVSAMKIPPPPRTHATSVAMSACGNFALVGTKGGIIYKYNVQSGHQRGSYPKNWEVGHDHRQKKPRAVGDISRTMKSLEKKMKISNRASNLDKKDVDAELEMKIEERRRLKLEQASHTGYAISGLAVDSVNKTVLSVGADCKLILWNFSTHAPHKKSPFTLPCGATRMIHIRESDLAAIALEDFSVVLFDCSSLSIVRRLGVKGSHARHTGPITDLGFSPDGRNLYTSSLDGSIRIFDLPTSSCVDWLQFSTPPTSLAVSPTGEFLATTHSGSLGISIWCDKSYYQTVHVDGSPLLEPSIMDEPVPLSDSPTPANDSNVIVPFVLSKSDHSRDIDEAEKDDLPPKPKAEGLITMSGLPPAHWKNLFHLELIKERNRPKEPPKKPPSAPFFLQWRPSEPSGAREDNQFEADDVVRNENEWAAAWSDDDEDEDSIKEDFDQSDDQEKREAPTDGRLDSRKRRKVTHYRSPLSSLLQQCGKKAFSSGQSRFRDVTDYISTLGPSAIDIALSSLCNGMHDKDEGLPLLLLASEWFVEACQARERFEVVNAYLNRFLHIHAALLTEIESGVSSGSTAPGRVSESERRTRAQLVESLARLKVAQQAASAALEGKMKHTLCLLHHFSRMV